MAATNQHVGVRRAWHTALGDAESVLSPLDSAKTAWCCHDGTATRVRFSVGEGTFPGSNLPTSSTSGDGSILSNASSTMLSVPNRLSTFSGALERGRLFASPDVCSGILHFRITAHLSAAGLDCTTRSRPICTT